MKMKIKNKEIITMFNALDSLGNKDMPITMTYKVVNNIDTLLNAYQIFDKAKGKAKDDKEIEELLEIEKEIDLETFDKQEMVEAGITLTPVQLVGLKRLIHG